MPLNFTDQELADTSLEYVNYPTTKQDLIDGRAKVQSDANVQFDLDQSNKKWTDFYRDNVIAIYHQELPLLDEAIKTLYVGETLIQAAAKKGEVHFPATPPNVWPNLQPILIDSQNGLPTTPNNAVNEIGLLLGCQTAVTLLNTGFSDGSDSTNLETSYTIGGTSIRVDDVTGFAIGNRLLIISGSNGMFAKITGITQDAGFCTGEDNPVQPDQVSCEADNGTWTAPLEGTFDIEILTPPASNLPIGASVTNFASGFSNAEREESIATASPTTLAIFKGILDTSIQGWEDFLTGTYKPLLETNEDQKRKSEIQGELTNITTKISEIDDWQSFPSTNPTGTGTESRFGDIKLGELSVYLTARQGQNTARIAQINTALNAVTQDPSSGVFSGSGVYYDFTDWLNKRVHGATGTLASYFGFEIALEVIDQQIADLDSNRVEQDTVFRIEPFASEFIEASSILVTSTTGYSIGDSIKIFAEEQAVITTTIIDVQSNTIIIDAILSSDYSIANIARILKQF